MNFFQKEVKNASYLISAPVQRILWRAGDKISVFSEAIYEAKNLKKEREELERKNQKLLFEIVGLKEIRKENEILRQALEIGLEKEFELTLATVISKDAFEDSILINKGSQDLISKGMAVITQEKVLLGKISEVYENFSRVELISSAKARFSAKIQEKDISGFIQGKGKFCLSFERIPQNKEVSKGDIALTDALGNDFLPGLLVGQIKEIKKDDTESFQTAEVSPFFNIKNIEKLFVIITR